MSALTLGFFELLILVMLLVLIGGAVAAVVWFTRKGSVGGGRGRVRTEAQPAMDFARLEAEYGRLKAQFERGALTEADFKAQLEELMIEDEQGRWWILGYETGHWYVHDGEQWVQQEPPQAAPSAPPAHPPYPRAADVAPDSHPKPATAVPSRTTLGLKIGTDGISVLLITCGWIVAYLVGSLMPGVDDGAWDVMGLIGGVGGLITGLVLRRTEPPSPWKQVPVVTLGWAVGWSIFGYVGGPLAGLVGGTVTALALKWTHPSIQWKHVALVTIGWVSGWAVGWVAGDSQWWRMPGWVLYVGIGGAVGSWVMFWQLRKATESAP